MAEDYDRQLDACRQHTAFYYHSLGEYLRHFSGCNAAHVAAAAPEASLHGGFAALRRSLGVSDGVTAGDLVRLTPSGLEPIEGTVDYAMPAFLPPDHRCRARLPWRGGSPWPAAASDGARGVSDRHWSRSGRAIPQRTLPLGLREPCHAPSKAF
jgi:hypothetical protein